MTLVGWLAGPASIQGRGFARRQGMSDVTIADLIAWEPRLSAGSGRPMAGAAVPAALDRSLAWVVAARSGTPMLPALRGGEAVVLSSRLLDTLDAPLEDLLAEFERSGVVAVIVPGAGPMPTVGGMTSPEILRLDSDAAAPDIESELNRSLTELRGDLYRAGTELSREISRVAAAGGGSAALLSAAETALGMSLSLSRGPSQDRERWDSLTLPVGPSLELTASVGDPRRRALARLALRALHGPVTESLRRDEAARPRGAARAEAIGRLLDPGIAGSAEALARSLGLEPSARYRVAAVSGIDPAAVARIIGSAEDAGRRDGLGVLLVRADAEPVAAGRPDPALARLDRAAGSQGSIAISAPVGGVESLSDARDQAMFIADLQRRGVLSRRVVAFDDIGRIGHFRFVHALLADQELAVFARAALGDLPRDDRRRTLRTTLLAFLDAGGSQALTAERLGIHRNTLAYRLRRIAELAGRDPADPEHRLAMHIAALLDALTASNPPDR